MVPGVIGGRYLREQAEFDLAALARAAGAEFIEARVTRIHADSRTAELAGGRTLEYDLLSMAVGSETAGLDLPGVHQQAVPVKPIQHALGIVPALSQATAARVGAAGGVAVVIAGGGAAGVELAWAVRARLGLMGREREDSVTVIERRERLLSDRPMGASRLAEQLLARHRIGVATGTEIISATETAVQLGNGAIMRCDLLIWAAGAAAPALLRGSGLALDARGFVLVDSGLQSTSHPNVFAAGDAATLRDHPDTPNSGVYAVREGPVLIRAIRAALRKTAPPRYRPQSRSLVLLNTGDGGAILSYGSVARHGTWVMTLKDRIDQRFMRRFTPSPTPVPRSAPPPARPRDH